MVTSGSAHLLKKIQALLIDADGTLWHGRKPMPDLVPFIGFLSRRGLAFTIATNNSVEPASIYQKHLASFGVDLTLKNILTFSFATAFYLKPGVEPGKAVYAIGQDGLKQELEAAGFRLLPDSRQNAAAVVVGGDPGLTYDKLKHATLLIQRGAAFIGTNPDTVYPTEEGLVPECGTTLAALQAATGVKPLVIGKPHRHLFEIGMQRLHSQAKNTAMLGDRLDTDIHGAQQAGLAGILVTTGVDNEDTIPVKNIRPDLVVHSLTELVTLWEDALKA